MAVFFVLPLSPLATAGLSSIAGPLVTTVLMTVDVLRMTSPTASAQHPAADAATGRTVISQR